MNEAIHKGDSGAKAVSPSIFSRQHLDGVIAELAVSGSIELSTENGEAIQHVSKLLPFGMAVYVPKTLKRSLEDTLPALSALHQAGFDAVPHVAARQVSSLRALRAYLDRAVNESGVHRVMVIGGDAAEVSGPFKDSASLIESGVLKEAGIREVDVAGYPEGHPRISLAVLSADLDAKIKAASDQDLGINVITQFSFVPARIVEYCDELAHKAPQVPVYVGMAGPTNTRSLLRFARQCGVSESLRALSALGIKVARLACHTDPDEQAEVVARYRAGHEVSNVIGIHVFSFGGFARSAEWMRGKF
jgi:methylenetetrahydrofolate reductase (NADPH)